MENELLSASVRLSGKEVPGLAVRVLGTALMPWGASAGAAEAVEFGELAGWRRLSRLARELDAFDASMWRAPDIVAEHEDHALCEANGGSALFFGAALADWLGAWAGQSGRVVVALRNVAHAADLHAIPYWLARRGYAGCVATGLGVAAGAGQRDGSGIVFSVASAEGDGWQYRAAHDPMAVPGAACSLLSALKHGAPPRTAFDALLQTGGHSQADVRDFAWLEGNDAVVVAAPARSLSGFIGDACAYAIDSQHLSALKARAMAEGWPIPRDEWERLMRFADRSLIRTSERSREGAG
ncbi:hypothetical protein G3N58_32940 [Paraburkholderia sp. Ac-20342]|uniref:hypothetical protein n=1 Tax=Paraburkholderia sp. Ac-20342 TaxID=2703889 RepID=UPI00197E8359|nr:hypothetical protein [Paraburkholderia sp. Ac-20342]MBN3851579.1 hypothetical protein [Paraburkholderia sp. Ac-20342]